MYSDAKGRGNDNAVLWAVGTFLGLFIGGIFGFLIVILYVLVGRDYSNN